MRIPADETSVATRRRTAALPATFAVAALLALTGLGQGAAAIADPADAPAGLQGRAPAIARPAAAPAPRSGVTADGRRQPRGDDAERDRLLRLIILYGSGARPFGFFK
jgi:hypothetical protein